MLPTGKISVLSAYTSFRLLKTTPVFPWMISHQEQWRASSLVVYSLATVHRAQTPESANLGIVKLSFKRAKIIRASLVSVCIRYRRLLGQRSRYTQKESFHDSYSHFNVIYPDSTCTLLVHDLSKWAENRTPKQILDSICPK